jgi:hypothetical protein
MLHIHDFFWGEMTSPTPSLATDPFAVVLLHLLLNLEDLYFVIRERYVPEYIFPH